MKNPKRASSEGGELAGSLAERKSRESPETADFPTNKHPRIHSRDEPPISSASSACGQEPQREVGELLRIQGTEMGVQDINNCGSVGDGQGLEFHRVQGARAAAQMRKSGGSFTVLQAAEGDLKALEDAEALWVNFFTSTPSEEKARLKGPGGRGGPSGDLMLWGNGYSNQIGMREQFHIVCGDPDAQRFGECCRF